MREIFELYNGPTNHPTPEGDLNRAFNGFGKQTETQNLPQTDSPVDVVGFQLSTPTAVNSVVLVMNEAHVVETRNALQRRYSK